MAIGAHPGFNDLWGFGRRVIRGDGADEIERMVAYQIGALQALAALAGHEVTYVKVHGALNNMANEDDDLALAIARAVKGVDAASRQCLHAGACHGARIAEGSASPWRASSSPTAPMTIAAT